MNTHEFVGFPKMGRFSREVVVSEKIDGTNAQIFISAANEIGPEGIDSDCEDAKFQSEYALAFDADMCPDCARGLAIYAGSKTRWIKPGDDNYGFAAWVKANAKELFKLGTGKHFGEWWGQGIQRKYGLNEKRFSLFNVSRWVDPREDWPTPALLGQEPCPACCHVVPVIFRGPMDSINEMVHDAIGELIHKGSQAAPGFPEPEGIIIWHTAANVGFKKTLVDDHKGKTQ